MFLIVSEDYSVAGRIKTFLNCQFMTFLKVSYAVNT
jgi:hypothetical protein